MNQKPLDDLTIEELKKQEKILKLTSGFLGAAILIITSTGIFLTVVKKSFSFFNLSALCFIPIFIMNVNNLKKVAAEIKSRNI